ncbi:biotin--[acetyl-CoA-carboxylase] ligase [Lachnoclostridium sp. Marseille-P6806]|uniref:biotin--[acetyl-CoA-carboxylase] ligase n=1 Tax=Lachnoclostridium sp. Marseille-P6806 TaxID=2364793 RepID=UPI001031BB60|nr:biotin--[acetyl-CoA-carboxylase] ligase [Lachnoclostridium sp. Marseille-P6806]
MKKEILRRLKEEGDFLSGQQLSRELGISRTAVWKAVGRLREEGYPIASVPNRGYRLLDTQDADILNQAELESRLAFLAWVGHPVIFRAATRSTNDDIAALADEGSPEGTLVVSARQTKGKGRRGRAWISPDEGNIYMSLLLRPKLPTDIVPMVTIVMALAACEAANESAAASALAAEEDTKDVPQYRIKWPNDVVVRSRSVPAWRKMCGILTELRLEEREIRDVTIGIGINVNMTEFPEELRDTATSMRLAEGGRRLDRAALTARIWRRFEELYRLFEEAGSLRPLRARYEALLVNMNRGVRVMDPKEPFNGTAVGITDRGELRVLPDAVRGPGGEGGAPELRLISAGEVSVRGVEGYV